MLGPRHHHQGAGLGDAGEGAGDRDLVAAPRRGRAAAPASSGSPSRSRRARRGRHRGLGRQVVAREIARDFVRRPRPRATRATVALLASAHWQNSATFSGCGQLRAGDRRAARRRGETRLDGLARAGTGELAAPQRAADAVQDLRAGARLAHGRFVLRRAAPTAHGRCRRLRRRQVAEPGPARRQRQGAEAAVARGRTARSTRLAMPVSAR